MIFKNANAAENYSVEILNITNTLVMNLQQLIANKSSLCD
jgi:hypothetical protein